MSQWGGSRRILKDRAEHIYASFYHAGHIYLNAM